MIYIEIVDRLYQYDAYHISKAFFPNEEIKTAVAVGLESKLAFYNDEHKVFVIDTIESDVEQVSIGSESTDISQYTKEQRKTLKHELNQALYLHLCAYTKGHLDWGFMTGIRPTKMAMKKWLEYSEASKACDVSNDSGGESTSQHKAKEQTIKWLQDYYNVTLEKSELAADIAMREHELLKKVDLVNGYSIYIGIPFCPTRCSYCSFTAYPLEIWKSRMDEYLEAMYKELAFIASRSRDKNLDTIYIGGGTPTSLEAHQLDKLLCKIKELFSWDTVKEVTVEAGRPDSITREKLEVLKVHGVHRISINPQSMKQKTLCRVGRGHSVNQIYDCFQMAREIGFDNINMDVILGLPYEVVEDVEYTLSELMKLAPESLTVHTLAMKRTSKLTAESTEVDQSQTIGDMVKVAARGAEDMGLVPYYLYRQKSIAGNYENVGYAKPHKECIYNVLIMEEKQSVVAVGAGSATKIVLPREKDNIIRIENVKDVDQYISRIDEMIERKEEWLWH